LLLWRQRGQLQEYADRMAATLRAHEALAQALQIQIARLRKQTFGASSEKIEREIEQLELALESLEVAAASNAGPEGDEDVSPEAPSTEMSEQKLRRRNPRVSDDTPRERIVLDPGEACPDCGGDLRLLGEDVSKILELITARLKVIEIARLKKSCRRCKKSPSLQRLRAPSHAVWSDRACWLTYWSPSMTTIFRYTGRLKSSPAWGPIFPVPPSWVGAARACGFWPR
jgi:DNA repair exonuclease SbcCD ATPase subunit